MPTGEAVVVTEAEAVDEDDPQAANRTADAVTVAPIATPRILPRLLNAVVLSEPNRPGLIDISFSFSKRPNLGAFTFFLDSSNSGSAQLFTPLSRPATPSTMWRWRRRNKTTTGANASRTAEVSLRQFAS
jgi:hypothetical protein